MSTEPSRFDYVKYDDVSAAKQAKLKVVAQKVEAAVIALDQAIGEFDGTIIQELASDGLPPANVELARDRLAEVLKDTDDSLVALEEAYMWCGKAIRDEQLERNEQ